MNGQRCTAGSRLLVQRAALRADRRRGRRARARNIRVGDPFDPRTELGPLIRPEHHERVLGYIASARKEGARVLAGGERPAGLEDGQLPRRRRSSPTSTRTCGSSGRRSSAPCSSRCRSTTRPRPSGWRTPRRTGSPPTSGRTTSAAPTASRTRSTPACAGSTPRTSATCARRSAASRQSGIGREGGDYAFDFYCETEIVHVALGTHHIPRLGPRRRATA